MRVARTFAFVDLSGFTQFTDIHGDDEAVAVLSQFRAALRATASDIGEMVPDGIAAVDAGQYTVAGLARPVDVVRLVHASRFEVTGETPLPRDT